MRIDLEGRANGRVVISIEGKLNAPLQDSQPVDYARRLETGGSLLFLCPSHRIARMRQELLARAAADGQLADDTGWRPDASGVEWTALTRHRRLGIGAWARLFAMVRSGPGGLSLGLASDLHQLEGLVAVYEYDLLSWTPEELRSGGTGLTFSKALATTRVLCQIVTDHLGTPLAPAWHATRAAIKAVEEYWDWFGAEASLSGVRYWISFEPTLWGEDGAASPVRISLSRPDQPDDAERLYLTYLRMLAEANGRLREVLNAEPAATSEKDASWWMLPFPLRPGITSEEARDDMASAATSILGFLGEI